jgi:hypothetical protein
MTDRPDDEPVLNGLVSAYARVRMLLADGRLQTVYK